jgi:GntR family transcriptional regulator, transcriptional repressor for pyruvate dehydrogenase complex
MATEVRFEPIQHVRAHEYVAEQIRRYIGLRLIQPGELLPSERQLAALFAVGRPTVQHALRLLEDARLVEARRGRHGGTFVCQPSDDVEAMEELIGRVLCDRLAIAEMLDWRSEVEPAVAGVAAVSRRQSDIEAMRRTIAGMAETSSEPEYMRYDNEFHIAIGRATGNRFMVRAVEENRLRLGDVMTLLPESDVWHGRIADEHEAILGGIESRDRAAAEAAMQVHVANSAQGLRAVLEAVRRRRSP